ncbi:hypothetical protein B0H34DRAFT_163434 [Crassisporium funariophilum]|nr:hypothetical protein B0H34DRAFT_163434 [Crassisporium funariophilum]
MITTASPERNIEWKSPISPKMAVVFAGGFVRSQGGYINVRCPPLYLLRITLQTDEGNATKQIHSKTFEDDKVLSNKAGAYGLEQALLGFVGGITMKGGRNIQMLKLDANLLTCGKNRKIQNSDNKDSGTCEEGMQCNVVYMGTSASPLICAGIGKSSIDTQSSLSGAYLCLQGRCIHQLLTLKHVALSSIVCRKAGRIGLTHLSCRPFLEFDALLMPAIAASRITNRCRKSTPTFEELRRVRRWQGAV